MSKLYVQGYREILSHSGSLAASGFLSGSLSDCRGYDSLVGGVRTNASTVAACGVFIEQSFDNGLNWDLVSGSDAIAACTTAACNIKLVGNAVRVRLHNGATAASIYRAYFYIKPIG
jgi:hypothetical protein